MITIVINGKQERLDAPVGLLTLLEHRRLLERRIAIGYNGEVVHRDHWADVLLRDGDRLDIVQMVGGG
jgi:sulfur carrier protein